MSARRLDVYVRIDGSNDRLQAALDGGGLTTITLTHGLYAGADALAAELQTRLQVDDPDWTCAVSAAGVFTVGAAGHTIAITWTRTALRDWLGWAANVSGASNSATAPSTCQGVFVSTLAWHDPRPVGWRITTARADSYRHQGRSFRRASVRTWEFTARVKASELTQFRLVLRAVLRGMPARWHRLTDVATAWDWTSPQGYVDLHLDPEGRDVAEQWLDSGGARLVAEVPLRWVEVAA